MYMYLCCGSEHGVYSLSAINGVLADQFKSFATSKDVILINAKWALHESDGKGTVVWFKLP